MSGVAPATQIKKIGKRPSISVFGTVYNNVKTIRKSILSISRVLNGLPYEVVILDNYSSDGTYEELLKLKREGIPLRVYRLRCSRGAGRHIAAKLAKGKILVYVDFDCIYTPTLRLIIEEALRSHRAINLIAIPRTIYTELRGFKDLNRAEDIDLWARMHNKGLCVSIPPLRIWVRLEIESAKQPSFLREFRYARKLRYFKRLFINRMSQVVGGALTLKKLIREHILLSHKRFIYVFFETISFLPFIILAKITKWKNLIEEQSNYLSNYAYVKIMNICSMKILSFLLKMPHIINIDSLRRAINIIQYVSRFDTDLARDAYSKLYGVIKKIAEISVRRGSRLCQ